MSELVKKIISTYNDMSESKKYSYSYLEGYRQCVVDVQESEPQLNPDQEIVLEWLKRESYDSYFESTIRNLYYYLNCPKLSPLLKAQAFVESYKKLNDKQMAQVIQAFIDWWLIN